MFEWLKKVFASRAPEIVVVDEFGARRQLSHGAVEEVRWNEVERVEIITTDEGPSREDVFWLLAAGDHGCVVPGEFGQQVLDQISSYPGLNFEAVILAMGCTSNERFLVWEQEP